VTNAELGQSPFQEPLPISTAQDVVRSGALWPRIEASLERASELLNPILVKEARQALKSRQFVATFSLLLIFGWGWSLAGVAMLSQAAYYAPGGRFMLSGYFLILAVPLIVIVPFSAFRSLAAEREDGTFELLSITTLQARQIISGKLGSAVVQMAVYYSALAPCIAFTYLLRGVDVLTIGLLLFYTFLVSVMLSQIGLITATVTRSSHWQILLSVVLILFLAWCDLMVSIALWNIVNVAGSIQFDDYYFWIVQIAVLMFYASTFALLLVAAAAQISFASDNRSTKLRVIMLFQQLLWIGWMTYAWVESKDIEVLYVLSFIAGVYWFFAGSLLCGEGAQLSPRVKRSLPQSFLGRALFTWFNPGSGTGYIFAVLNMWCLITIVAACGIAAEVGGNLGGVRSLSNLMTGPTLCAAYLTVYMGIGRLLVFAVRGRLATGLVLPLLMNVVLALLGVFVPLVAAGWLTGFSTLDYNELQATNWAWTIGESVDGTVWQTFVPVLVYLAAAVVFVINLFLAMHEVEQVRLATPQRVLDDEWQLHPEKAPVAIQHSSPWDN
jgi:hypothetical protein